MGKKIPITRILLEEETRNLIGYLEHKFGKHGVGMTLFLSNFGEGGHIAYVSTVNREDMIKTIKEWLASVEAGLMTDPPGPRAEG